MKASESLDVELVRYASFIKGYELPATISDMQDDLTKVIGYRQRVGEVLNDQILRGAKKREEGLGFLKSKEDETETSRKAKLNSFCADEEHQKIALQNLVSNLGAIKMLLFSAIKTQREESV